MLSTRSTGIFVVMVVVVQLCLRGDGSVMVFTAARLGGSVRAATACRRCSSAALLPRPQRLLSALLWLLWRKRRVQKRSASSHRALACLLALLGSCTLFAC